MSSSMDDDARAYNEYASMAVDLSQAQCVPVQGHSYSTFSVIRSARDIDNNKRQRYLCATNVPSSSSGETDTSTAPSLLPPVPLSDDIQWRLPSPTGKKIAVLVKGSGKDDNGKQLQELQVWTHGGHQLERRILLNPDQKLHGKVIYEPGGFGVPAWNADETCLVYSAERTSPKTSSYFEEDDSTKKNDTKTEEKGKKGETPTPFRGGQYTLGQGKSEGWGERYNKQSPLLDLFVVNVETQKVGRIQNIPGNEEDSKDQSGTDAASTTTLGGYVLGQPVWCPNKEGGGGKSSSVVYTGWDAGGGSNMPRRLGMIYCQQRPSKLYHSSVAQLLEQLGSPASDSGIGDRKTENEDQPKDQGFRVLTPDLWIAKSPRFSPVSDGQSSLVFLATEKSFDTHNGCFGLHAMVWDGVDQPARVTSPPTSRVVIGQVWNPLQQENQQSYQAASGDAAGLPFPGLFAMDLPTDPFVTPTHLVMTTQWGSCQKLVRISLLKGTVDMIRLEKRGGGSALENHELLCLGKDGSAFVVIRSATHPGTVWRCSSAVLIGDEDPQSEPSSTRAVMQFYPLASTKFSNVLSLPELDFDVSIQVLPQPTTFDSVDQDLVVQSILMLPNKSKYPKPPLVVCPHGGPHSAYTTSYFHSLAYLCGYGGYAVLIPNYRGSTGFGQASVEALPTRIGDMDVKDVMMATDLVRESGLVDPDRVGISGGSHGGFLTAHCTSQYPDIFKAASTRNPVVNVASMVTATDIADWCHVEATGSYDWKEYRPVTKEELDLMYSCSPIKWVKEVKTPTLIGLGMVDLRVPPSQGLEWYHSLRSMGVPTELLVYPDDCHAIDLVAPEADYWVNTKRWFDKYLRVSES